MLKKWEYWFLTAVGAVTLVLVIVNCSLFLGNRGTQMDVNNRQQFIQQSIQLEQLYRELLKGLADLSVKTNDRQIRDLLSSQGITINASPQAGAGGTDPRGAGK